MTARRPGHGGQASGIAGAAGYVANGHDVGLDRSPRFSWEDWFLHASALQRVEALGLAQKQGVLYPHQLPHLTNGTKVATSGSDRGLAPTLTRVLAGKVDTPPPISTPQVTFVDESLDEVQQQAVLRALATPDVFLLQGLPGTGKSRVLAEIMLQAAAAGERVLFLAAHHASLDVVLHRLVGRSDALPIRYLDRDEKPESLPAWLRGFTLEEQRRTLAERVLVGARANRDQAEARCRAHRDEEPIWAELQSIVHRANDLDSRITVLKDQWLHLPETIEAELKRGSVDSPFAAQIARQRQSLEHAMCELNATLQTQRELFARNAQEADRLNQRIAELAPGYQAKQGNKFWSPSFWPHAFSSQIVLDMESTQAELAAAQAKQQSLEQEIARLEQQRTQQRTQADVEQAAAVQAEVQTRQAAVSAEIAALQHERDQLDERWQVLCQPLKPAPAAATPAAIETAHQLRSQARNDDDEQCRFATQWTRFVEETGCQLATRLPALANVVAATITTWQSAPVCREAVVGSFDLLIIEDADSLTETDLSKLAKHAPRCVLVACLLSEAAAPVKAPEKTRSFAGVQMAAALVWPRLWQSLAGERSTAELGNDESHAWFREGDRLVCQLVALTKEDRQYLDSEGLADAADIELRILHRPKATPCLAQMVFPATWSFHEALAFVIREAQEIPLPPLGRTCWWREDALHWSWHTAPSSVRVHSWLEADTGVGIGIVADVHAHADSARIARIEFDKSAGWDRTRAEAWLHRHHQGRDHGRTAFLQAPHRFGASLAKAVVGLVCTDDWSTPADAADCQAFEFCAVPPVKNADVPKDGAGLELDLAATRHVDRLPSELRQGLPSRGFVNYLEAQALVRRLESLKPTEFGPTCRVAVLALYESQAELLRRLIARSEVLRSRSFTLEVSLPSRMHQHECDIVLLSLTRSHTHRCGAFGDDPRELPLALTRACSRLFVFGDLGMLSKRAHWTGPLDHLDAAASQQECVRIARLAALGRPVHTSMSNGTANGK